MKYFSKTFLVLFMSYSNIVLASTPEKNDPLIEIVPVSIDATSTTDSTYLAFEDGLLSVVAADKKWQISVKRTNFQTNSGSSGEGSVGVFDSELTDFASVTECAVTALTSDTLLPASGAPGSVATSGNAILNAWYNYDMATHTVTSKKLVYLVVEGESCFKFQILDYISAKFSVQAEALPSPVRVESQTPEVSNVDL
jgi:hypothetical protein